MAFVSEEELVITPLSPTTIKAECYMEGEGQEETIWIYSDENLTNKVTKVVTRQPWGSSSVGLGYGGGLTPGTTYYYGTFTSPVRAESFTMPTDVSRIATESQWAKVIEEIKNIKAQLDELEG